jgi:hypothetical protein
MARTKHVTRSGPAADNGLAGNPPLDPAYVDPHQLAAHVAAVKKMKRQFRAENNMPNSDSDEEGDATQMMSSAAAAEQGSEIEVGFTLTDDEAREEAIDKMAAAPTILPSDRM